MHSPNLSLLRGGKWAKIANKFAFSLTYSLTKVKATEVDYVSLKQVFKILTFENVQIYFGILLT